MSIQNINVPGGISILSVNTLSTSSKVVLLPASSTNQGRFLLVKDTYGNAQSNNIQISTVGLDRIDGRINRYPFSTSWGTLSLIADGNLAWRVSGLYTGSLTPAPPAGGSLYTFTTFTFTNASVTGRLGPNLAQIQSAYSATAWTQNTAFLNMSNQGIQLWTVPQDGNYQITCAGAEGGAARLGSGGLGATMVGTFALTRGSIIKILVGQQGLSGTNQGGGGGGSFVTLNDNTPLICAGGGGGGEYQTHALAAGQKGATTATTANRGTNGNTNSLAGLGGSAGTGGSNSGVAGTAAGGGGLLTNGADAIAVSGFFNAKGGIAFVNGGTGGISASNSAGVAGDPGFGGGGGADWNYETGSGGGGGYSGGGAAATFGVGGGGGSFNSGTNQTNTGSNRAGMGFVTITRL